ncbi:MAG: hypothetical protein K2X39_08575, partial [Silvanigrellaceae bacterium]|nr:hypothetical protein [Silvanigrellaceae bacterium]
KYIFTHKHKKKFYFSILTTIILFIIFIFFSLLIFEKKQYLISLDRNLYNYNIDEKVININLFAPWKDGNHEVFNVKEKLDKNNKYLEINKISEKYQSKFLIIPRQNNIPGNYWTRFFLTPDLKNAIDLNTIILRPDEEIHIKNFKSYSFRTLVFQNLAVSPHKRDKKSKIKITNETGNEFFYSISPEGFLEEINFLSSSEDIKISWENGGSGILIFYGFKQEVKRNESLAFANLNLKNSHEVNSFEEFFTISLKNKNYLLYNNFWPLFLNFNENNKAIFLNNYPGNYFIEDKKNKFLSQILGKENNFNFGESLFKDKISLNLVNISNNSFFENKNYFNPEFIDYADKISHININYSMKKNDTKNEKINNFTYILFDHFSFKKQESIIDKLVQLIFKNKSLDSLKNYLSNFINSFSSKIMIISTFSDDINEENLLTSLKSSKILIETPKSRNPQIKNIKKIISSYDLLPTIFSIINLNNENINGVSLLNHEDTQNNNNSSFIVIRNNEDDIFIFNDESIFTKNIVKSEIKNQIKYLNMITDFQAKYKTKILSFQFSAVDQEFLKGEIKFSSSIPILNCYSNSKLNEGEITKNNHEVYSANLKMKPETNNAPSFWLVNCVLYGDLISSTLQTQLKVNDSPVPPSEISVGRFSLKPYQDMAANNEFLLHTQEFYYLAFNKFINHNASKYFLWFSPFFRKEHKLKYFVDFEHNLNLNTGERKSY